MIQMIRSWTPAQKTLFAVLALAVVVAGGWFVWWTASPLFINQQVSEGLNAASVKVLERGQFINGNSFHKVSGTAKVVAQGGGRILRLDDDFNPINGPALHVYLVKAGGVKEGFLDLGQLKGNQGGQNYGVPAGTDLSQYPQVYVWCKAFGVKFGSAKGTQVSPGNPRAGCLRAKVIPSVLKGRNPRKEPSRVKKALSGRG